MCIKPLAFTSLLALPQALAVTIELNGGARIVRTEPAVGKESWRPPAIIKKSLKKPIYARPYVNQSAQQQSASQVCSDHAGMGWIDKYGGPFRQMCSPRSGSTSSFGCRRIEPMPKLLQEGPANVNDFAYAQLDVQRTQNAILKAKDKVISNDYICSGSELLVSSEKAVVKTGGGPNFLVRFGVACDWVEKEPQLVEMYKHWVPLDFVHTEAEACAHASEQVEELTFLMYPLDFWNPYEGGHQLLNTFATGVAMDLDMQNTRILWLTERMDTRGSAKLKDLAEQVFSRAGPALTPRMLKSGETCLKNAVVPISGAQSLFYRSHNHMATWNFCPHGAPLLFGWGKYLLDAMNIRRRDVESSQPFLVMSITILTRIPGRREMENQDELEHAIDGEPQSPVQHVRELAMQSEDTDVEGEATATAKLVLALSKPGRIVKAARFDRMPVREQLSIMQDTDLIISPHAASLTWMIVSPRCTQLLEMAYGPNHYLMISRFMNISHTFTGGPGIDEMVFSYSKKEISHMVELTDKAEDAWRHCRGQEKAKLMMRKELHLR